MNSTLKQIEDGKGPLTEGERAALDVYADLQGVPRVMYQVYDDTGITDDDYLGSEKAGPLHSTKQDAVNWALEHEQNFEAFSVYGEKRYLTRKREIGYSRHRSPVHMSY